MKCSILVAIVLVTCLSQTVNPSKITTDKQEIQSLIRNVLVWSGSKKPIDLLPFLTDIKNMCVGFNKEKLKTNLEKLKATDYFTAGFIENYNQIILTLDKKIRNKEIAKWSANELPPFNFASDANPWCDCQDKMSWNLVEVEVMELNNKKGTLRWKWGKAELINAIDEWKAFRYKFNVEKENEKWRVSYLEGFDFKECTGKVG